MSPWRAAQTLILFSAFLTVVHSRIITIDDSGSDDETTHTAPVFLPSDGWSTGPSAHVVLDTSKVFQGTWHDGTRHPGDPPKNISFSFTGTTLDVFCIITNTPDDPSGRPFDRFAKYQFILDGQVDGTGFEHEPENIKDYAYNTTVYSNHQLDNRKHDFTIALDADPANKTVLMLFDSASYTIPEDPPSGTTLLSASTTSSDTPEKTSGTTSSRGSSSSTVTSASSASSGSTGPLSKSPSSPNPSSVAQGDPQSTMAASSPSQKPNDNDIPAIIGGTLGGVALVILAIIFFLFWRRQRPQSFIFRSRKSKSEQDTELSDTDPRPFVKLTPQPMSDRYSRSYRDSTFSTQYPSSIAASTDVFSSTTTDTEALVSEISELRGALSQMAREQRQLREYLQPPRYQD